MYDVFCSNINDSVSFWNMSYIELEGIYHDFRHQYNVKITNCDTKKEYMIITNDDYSRFLESEGLK